MAIRASSSKHIDQLIADLANASVATRDGAVARLTVIGARAVDRLLAFTTSAASPAARGAALRALEGIGDERALAVGLQGSDDRDASCAQAAIAVVRLFLKTAEGAKGVDRLTAIALDAKRPEAVRVAAIRALQDLEKRTIAPLMRALAKDANAEVRAAIEPGREASRESPAAEDPDAIRKWVAREGKQAPLVQLLEVVERLRDREGSASPARRGDWATARAASHLALARRESRLALYDLKESLENASSPLPVDSLAALGLIGDTLCLEPLAQAYTRSSDAWWRDRLRDVFREIVKRERLTARHAVIKRIAHKAPDLLERKDRKESS